MADLAPKPKYMSLHLQFKQLYRVSCFNPIGIALMAFHLDTWTISDLSGALKCSTACIRKRINLWQNCGLLKEEAKDTFRLVEDTSKVASHSSSQAPALLGVDVDEMNVEHQAEHDRKEHEHTVSYLSLFKFILFNIYLF
jgi:hypothetical protein